MNTRARLFFISLMGVAVALGGCQTYQPQPLTAAVQQSLTPSSMTALRVQAEELHHPILKPIPLDFDRGLSPDGAAILAVLLNPKLHAARDQRGLADAQLLQAGLLPNPQLSASFDEPVFGAEAGKSAYGFGLGWDLQPLITRSARRQAAGQQREAVELDIAWQEWQAAQAARTAVYQVASLEAQVRLSASLEARLKENLNLVRRAVDVGQMTEIDLAAAEAALNQSQANLLGLRKQTEQQRLALNLLLGVPPETRFTLQSDLPPPADSALPPAEWLIDGLEQRRLDLIALRHGYAGQEATVRAAILAQFPKLNFDVRRMRDTSNIGTIGIGVTLDLPIFDRNQGVIAQEQATRQKLFDEYTDRLFEARAEIVKRLADARWLNKQIAAAQSAEPGLDRLVRTYRRAVNAGQADVLSYYTAWNNLTQKQIEVLALQQQLTETHIALELASGLYRLEAGAAEEKLKGSK